MKKAKNLLWVLIYWVARLLESILWLPAYLFALATMKVGEFGAYSKRLSIAKDKYGNVLLAPFLNRFAIKPDGYKFGNPKETISSALGKNKRDGTLLFLGKVLDKILDLLDKNHSLKSINENV